MCCHRKLEADAADTNIDERQTRRETKTKDSKTHPRHYIQVSYSTINAFTVTNNSRNNHSEL
ncbi:hypothetical protein E2C01_020889 [Portunus trituberculatus]|uniref:Uncharacterized protein n=1 Tax=Portunus trituberculatus TaxID=210409 RepID=A0A5B7E1D4_PORTR|nr:hypothetical protein [Portunus trituberculatus]